MTREETLKGIAALSGNESILKLIEVQQELSCVCCHFAEALEDYYGERQQGPQEAIQNFYDKSKEMDSIINAWLGEILYCHFSEIR